MGTKLACYAFPSFLLAPHVAKYMIAERAYSHYRAPPPNELKTKDKLDSPAVTLRQPAQERLPNRSEETATGSSAARA
jgi:hypothetical protein